MGRFSNIPDIKHDATILLRGILEKAFQGFVCEIFRNALSKTVFGSDTNISSR
jgi:hypothetical protein